MKDREPVLNNQHLPRKIPGIIIFDKNGNSIGVAVSDGSLDYAPQVDLNNIVVVIRPPGKGK